MTGEAQGVTTNSRGPAERTGGSRRRRMMGVLAGVIVVAGGTVLVLERQTRPEPAPRPPVTEPIPSSGSGTLPADFGPYPAFGADTVFRTDISKAAVNPAGPAMTARLTSMVDNNWGGVAPLNVAKYGAAYAVAVADTPKQDVRFVDCQNKGARPPGLYDGPKHFAQVPIPGDAVAAPGTDGHLAVYDPRQDRLWEFWIAQKTSDGWQACWGGRIDGVSRATGQFPAPYGVSASGLALTGLMVSLRDAQRHEIDHAMGLVVMEAARGHSYPANRDDGISDNPAALREGTRLRLDPAVDVTALQLTPLGKAVARAAQKYGFIVVDKGGAVAVVAETGDRWVQRVGVNPWSELVPTGEAYQALKGFPWSRLQVIEHDWGRPGR